MANPRRRHRGASTSSLGQRWLASELGIHPAEVSAAARDTVDELTRAGYQAYLVGGCVRDLLLGLHPKDFDAVTNATPQQIKQVFGRRCRVIGRRFELAHVYQGRELIEVATFRAPPPAHQLSQAGLVTRDNVWGTIEQDYIRRDFTANALYYQPKDGIVLDFCQGVEAIQARELRLLGDPRTRMEEDPVRLLRALRFAAKLNFTLDPAVQATFVPALIARLDAVSPHRLYDEVQKLFLTGHLQKTLSLLIEQGIWSTLFPKIHPEITPLIALAARNTDERLAQGKTINPAFFMAVMLWHNFQQQVQTLQARQVNLFDAIQQAATQVLNEQGKRTAMPGFAAQFIKEVWELQWRLTQPKARQIPVLVQQPRFRAGFDFLVLRERVGEPTDDMGQWWDRYQQISTNDQREAAIRQLNRDQQRQRRRATEPVQVQPDIPQPAVKPMQDAHALPDMDEPIASVSSRPPRQSGPVKRQHRDINGRYV